MTESEARKEVAGGASTRPSGDEVRLEARRGFTRSLADRSIHLDGLPTELTIELTSRCQLGCSTCPRENLFRSLVPNKEMSWDLFERLARTYVPSLDYLSLAGGMGEPLLYSRFTDAVRLARSLSDDLILSVSTNALLPGTVRLMRSVAGALSFVQISMDAVGQEFDRIVGRRNVFPVFERTVRELVGVFERAGTKLRFNTVVTPESFEGLSMVVESIAAWGGTYVYLPGMNLAATNLPISRYDFYTAPEYAEAMQKLVETGARLGVTVVWHDMRVVKGFGGCKAPWNNFYIGTDGVLAPCCAKPFAALLNFGHVEDGGLAARINDEQLQEFRRHSVLNTTPEFCSSCAVQHTPRPVIPQP